MKLKTLHTVMDDGTTMGTTTLPGERVPEKVIP